MVRRKEGENNLNFHQTWTRWTISWYQNNTYWPNVINLSRVRLLTTLWCKTDNSSSQTCRQQLRAASLTSPEPVSSVSSKNIKASYPVLLEHLREKGHDEEKQASHSSRRNPKYLIVKAKRETETEADSLCAFLDFCWQTVGWQTEDCANTSEKRWRMTRPEPRDTTGQQPSDILYSNTHIMYSKVGIIG